jgi:hypothetical protein
MSSAALLEQLWFQHDFLCRSENCPGFHHGTYLSEFSRLWRVSAQETPAYSDQVLPNHSTFRDSRMKYSYKSLIKIIFSALQVKVQH